MVAAKKIEKLMAILDEATNALCQSLEKHFPGITTKKYEKGDDEWTFKERMTLGINMELAYAGYHKDLDTLAELNDDSI